MPSKEPVRIVLPSGPKATGADAVLVPQRAADRPAGRAVPEAGGAVVATRQDGAAVGAEGHRRDPVLVDQGLADRRPGGGVPEPRRLVPAPGQDGPAVGAERHGR